MLSGWGLLCLTHKMPEKYIHSSGAVEKIDTVQEKQSKEKLKTRKKASDLTDAEIKELVFELAKKFNLIPNE